MAFRLHSVYNSTEITQKVLDKAEYRFDFDDESIFVDLTERNSRNDNGVSLKRATGGVKDGLLVVRADGVNAHGSHDPQITFAGLDLDTRVYNKLKFRMKRDVLPNTNPDAKRTVTGFRFDPANTNGNFVIDYIRFIKSDYNKLSSHEELINAGYTATRLFQDEQFERGFYVNQFEQKELITHGRHDEYCETDESPLWQISPWWSGYDLIDDRNPTNDKYTISDVAGVNTVRYNPEEKSVIMRQNATKYYNGKPHILEEHRWWPHLIVSQDSNTSNLDKKLNSASGDRMFVEVDVRLVDFKDTTNKEGINNISYGMVFHLRTVHVFHACGCCI